MKLEKTADGWTATSKIHHALIRTTAGLTVIVHGGRIIRQMFNAPDRWTKQMAERKHAEAITNWRNTHEHPTSGPRPVPNVDHL